MINEQASIQNFSRVAPSEIGTTMSVCPQCGMLHPPLKPGQKCPNAKEIAKDGTEIPFGSFFDKLKIICVSQIKQKDIKDATKLLNHVILMVTKDIENYKEE